MAAGSGLLKAKDIDSSATPGSIIAAPELSNNLDRDKVALKNFNESLKDGLTPAEAYANHLTNVSKAAQEAARQRCILRDQRDQARRISDLLAAVYDIPAILPD